MEWESRLKDAERAMILKDQEREKLNLEISRLNQDLSRTKSELGNSRLNREEEARYR